MLRKCGYYPLLRVSPLFSFSTALHSTLKNFYEILEISPKATHVEIKSAYFAQTKKYHPDVSDNPDSVLKFRELTEAYETLRHPDKRRMYDRRLFRHSSQFPADAMQRPGYTSHDAQNWSEMQKSRQRSFRSKVGKSRSVPFEHYNVEEHYRAHYGGDEQELKRKKQVVEDILRHHREHYVPPSKRMIRLIPIVFLNTILLTIVLHELW